MISRETNASKIRQMEFVKMGEIEGALHALKNMGRILIDEAKYKKMLELDVLPDEVRIEELHCDGSPSKFYHISI